MKKQAAIYLKHIHDAICKIETYTSGGRQIFLKRPMVQDAVIRNLEIIGEAVRNLPVELRHQHPSISWRSIRALRNVLIHEYFGVDLEIVWRVVNKRLPLLKRHVESLLADTQYAVSQKQSSSGR